MGVHARRPGIYAVIAVFTIGLSVVSCSREAGNGADSPAAAPAPSAAVEAPPPQPISELERLKLSNYPWLPLQADHLHDPDNPALRLLQQPSEALSELPPAREGNQVDWVAALRDGYISPRTNIQPETKVNVLDLDVIMNNTAGLPAVKFPHRAHTEWLDCNNCHDKIFKKGRGSNAVNMFKILQGFYCGQCHGAVSFPLTQCQRCHSMPHRDADIPARGQRPGK